MMEQFIHFPALALLVAAHSAPVLVARILGTRWAAPIDAHHSLPDHRPLFGSHKTWRGLLTGTLAAAAVGEWVGTGFMIGAAFGLLALAGDLGSSFVKRRLGHESGKSVPLLDQLPESLLPMVLLYGPLGLDSLSMTGTAFVFLLLDLAATRATAALFDSPGEKRETLE